MIADITLVSINGWIAFHEAVNHALLFIILYKVYSKK